MRCWLQMKIMNVLSNEDIWEEKEVERLFAMRRK